MYNSINKIVLGFLLAIAFSSCKKYLDEKPDAKLSSIEGLDDLQLLLDGYDSWNNSYYPYASEILSEDFYLTTTSFNAVTIQLQRDVFLFQRTEQTLPFWSNPYNAIYRSNIILDEIKNVNSQAQEQAKYNNIKGSALFFRGIFHYGLAQLFAQPYDKQSASNDLGLPLRLNANFEELSVRSSVQETYNQIISDLKESVNLLPITPLVKTRPSKPAAYGALAKVYLAMQEYDSAGKYARLCLSTYGSSSLLNYNNPSDVSLSATAPFKQLNKEVVFQLRSQSSPILANTRAIVDSNLYNAFDNNDLRKTAYFKSNGNGTYQFKGDYDGVGSNTGYVFAGIVLDEMYLISAESSARSGNVSASLQDLNALLQTRWLTGTFVPITASNAQEALSKILLERRKELIRRGTRWTDLRRFRKDPLLAVTIKRIINNQVYELKPEDAAYTLKLPKEVIALSNMPQNP